MTAPPEEFRGACVSTTRRVIAMTEEIALRTRGDCRCRSTAELFAPALSASSIALMAYDDPVLSRR